jgi:predicted AAA+ superfamily ATPase
MDIPRFHATEILHRLEADNRIILLFGPRQTGKTTLAKSIAQQSGRRFLALNGDDPETVALLTEPEELRLSGLVAGYEGLFLDEAQRIPGIGLVLKRLHDQHPQVRLLVTGSSSLELAGQTREALTGRTWTYTLFPIATSELAQLQTPHELSLQLSERLVLGSYPALFSLPNRQDRIAHLKELVNAYLYKDILDLSGLRSPRKLRDLLRLLAYQVGSEVSYQELGRTCGLSADTVISYVDLLEKSFVVYRLGAYSRNLRKEVSRKDKVYFVDNGVRNALIDDFKEPELRGDVGALWENFLVSERRKRNAANGFYGSSWFWRVHTGAELDYLEDADGRLDAFEFKWGDKVASLPKGFADAYPGSGFTVINRGNWQQFCALTPPTD